MRNITMGCMKLGSKADVFHLEGQSWLCMTGLRSDICIKIDGTGFHLHKFPLLSRSHLIEKCISDCSVSYKSQDKTEFVLDLHELPGGAKTFLLVAKFCYGVKFELTAADVVRLRCAAEYLQMREDLGEGNLISQMEVFLDEVLSSWVDTLAALETCDEELPNAEELSIISRCIDSLATKACSDPRSAIWNGICSTFRSCPKTVGWWYEDVAILRLPLFKRFMFAVGSKRVTPDLISGAVVFYAKSYLPLNDRQSSFNERNPGSTFPVICDADQRILIEEIIALLPDQYSATPTNFLLRLLRMAMILHISSSSQEILERRIGAQLDQADLQDLLIPNTGYSTETNYDIECVERMVNHFSFFDHDNARSKLKSVVGHDRLVESSCSVVANLIDNYLAKVAPDVNLKLGTFMSLAGSVPDYARTSADGIYGAIDLYFKAHSWLIESERELLCKLMNCEKLSEEASRHAVQNERLPIRVVVRVLSNYQLQLHESLASKSSVSNNLKNSPNSSGKPARKNDPMTSSEEELIPRLNEMMKRVSEIEKKCEDMKHEMEEKRKVEKKHEMEKKKKKPVKSKGRWSNFCKGCSVKDNSNSVSPQGKAVIDGRKG